MNMKSTVSALSLMSVLSFGAFAATPINAEQAQGRQAMGSVSVSQTAGVPMDMQAALSKKADKAGASAYRVVEARTGNTWHATAELYK